MTSSSLTPRMSVQEVLQHVTPDFETGEVLNRHGDPIGGPNDKGYLYFKLKGKQYYNHRVVLGASLGHWPLNTDHINGIKDDNRLTNLRNVTPVENNKNRSMHKNNSTGYPGVYFDKRDNGWYAQIGIGGKQIPLGYYSVARYGNARARDMAVTARKRAERKHGFHRNSGR